MNTRVRYLPLLLAALAVLLCAQSALASPDAVVRDCAEDGQLDGNYSDADKRAALNRIPADLDEYSDCRALIGGAVGGGKGKAGASALAGGAAAKGPAARRAAERRAKKQREARLKRAARESELGARSADPRDAGVFKAANTANGIPLPVTLALVAVALAALAGALLSLGRRNPALAGALRRVTPRRFRD